MKKTILIAIISTATLIASSQANSEIPFELHVVATGGNETLLTDNGNFLFYNSPVSASFENRLYFAWVTNSGQVFLRTQHQDGSSIDTIIHSFAEDINKDIGHADDHAAPAVLLDEQSKELIIAVSYHGSPMYVYAHDISSNGEGTRLVEKVSSRYTYPRLFEYQGTIHLLARLQPEGIRAGHLVMRNAKDGFGSEQIVIDSEDGEVVYAGSPAVTETGFAIAYSKHSYEENRLIGFNMLDYDIEGKASSQCNFSAYIEPDSYSNRPTGIGYNGENLVIATTYTDQENGEPTEEYENFQRENTVVILKGEIGDCDSFDIIENQEVSLPYYHTSIAVNDTLEWLYFDGNQHHTNANIPHCFTSQKMMYPNFTANGIVYAAMNRQYSIRDFDNSIIYCARNDDS